VYCETPATYEDFRSENFAARGWIQTKGVSSRANFIARPLDCKVIQAAGTEPTYERDLDASSLSPRPNAQSRYTHDID
jgi:hypothetical protein